MASSIRKKLDALCNSVFDEMDEDQLKSLFNFLKSSTGSGTQEVAEDDEDEEEEVKPKKKRVVEEDDEDEDEVVSKKKKKVVEEDEDDEDEEEEVKPKKRKVVEEDDEDEEEDETPKKKKRVVEEDEDDEDEEEEDGDDLDSKSVPALKKIATDECGYEASEIKAALKKSTNEKKTLIKIISNFRGTVEGLVKKKQEFLDKLVLKHDVKYSKPRGRSGPEAKKLAAAKALAAAGYPFDE